FDECKLAIAELSRDPREDLVKLRQVLEERLAAPIHGGSGAKSQILSTERDRIRIERLIINRQIGQANQALSVVVLCLRRLHQLAAEVIIKCRKSACVGMTPGIALDRSQTLCGQLSRDGIHAYFWINQDVGGIIQDRVTPTVDRQWTLDKAIAKRNCL